MDLSPAFVGLDDRDRIYVESRLRGMSKTASAAAAGLSPSNASRFEDQPHIQAALERGRQISIQATGMTRERISEMLLDAYRSATNAMEMVAAARELGRLHGLYAPQKVEMDHTHRLKQVQTQKDLRQLPTSELLKLADMRGNDIIDAEFTEVGLTRMVSGAEIDQTD